jgi:uncharacterized protein
LQNGPKNIQREGSKSNGASVTYVFMGCAMLLTRQQWLLIFLALPEGPYRTDQLRTTKGMFLFAQECPEAAVYDFEPYDYGPFSRQLYSDLDSLVYEGLIRRIETGRTRNVFEVASRGSEFVKSILKEAPDKHLDCLKQIKRRVTSLNFTDLLSWIYGEYPEYAVNSKARV